MLGLESSSECTGREDKSKGLECLRVGQLYLLGGYSVLSLLLLWLNIAFLCEVRLALEGNISLKQRISTRKGRTNPINQSNYIGMRK